VVLIYWCQVLDPEKVRAYLRESEEMAVVREHKRLEEKVNSWRYQETPPMLASSNY